MAAPSKVCIIGSGNWGSAVAKIVGANAARNPTRFDPAVRMWVFEETTADGRKLTDVINSDHENVKYLPGHRLPPNVVAVGDLAEACRDADVLLFVVPHQFVGRVCDGMQGSVKAGALGMSLIKGLMDEEEEEEGGGKKRGAQLRLVSDAIRERLPAIATMAVLMGANIAGEVADGKFCESTVGCADAAHGALLKELMQTESFRVSVVEERRVVELCGALKNVVAVGAGFCDGLGFGDNTKAAVIRLGLMEMIAFARAFFCDTDGNDTVSSDTFLQSCGVADLVATCYGGRNRRVAEAFARTPGKSVEELEGEMLAGQKLQGPATAAQVHRILEERNLAHRFPLFTAVYRICFQNAPVAEFIGCLQNHPEHM